MAIIPGITTETDAALPVEPESTDRLLKILRGVPRGLVIAIPYLLILLLLLLAILYAIQAYREYRSTERYNKLILKIQNIQFASKNFVALTSHYLNTPLGIMQLSTELLVSVKAISLAKSESIDSLLNKVSGSIHQLLSSNNQENERLMSTISSARLGAEVRSASFNPLVWVPIIISGLLIVAQYLLFSRANIYQVEIGSLAVQIGLFAICILLILLAWRSLVRNKYARINRAKLLEAEQHLAKIKSDFITKTIDILDGEIAQLKSLSSNFTHSKQAEPFLRGLVMLSDVEKSLILLSQYTNVKSNNVIKSTGVEEIIANVLSRQADAIRSNNITISKQVSDGLMANIDKSALILLIGSALNNAIKFSKTDGKVSIQATAKAGGIKITVSDNGAGIAKDKIDQLMMPFARATDALHYDYEGLGLGLYLDRIILDQINGSINISSNLNKGTKVVMYIPRGDLKDDANYAVSTLANKQPQ